MSLSKSFAGKVRRSNPPICRQLVDGMKSRRLLIRSCLVAVFCGAIFALVAFAGFITAPTYPVGIAPRCVAVGDFNGDGILDLAVANVINVVGFPGTVSILLGKGDGTFQAAHNYAVGAGPQSVVVGDFNGDGHLDLAVANGNSAGQNMVSVLLGNGDGTFKAAQNYVVASGAAFLAVGDFNGDGNLDLAEVGSGFNGTVSLLLGNGDGTFQPVQDVPNAPVGGLVSVAVGDFNGDGRPDLVVTNSGSSTVSVLLGNGDGTFQAAQDYAIDFQPGYVVVGDFNGDGCADIAVGTGVIPLGPGPGVSVLLGNGDGTFQAAQNYAVDSGLGSLAVGDFNGDGRLDLAGIGTFGPVFILLGKGDGTFQAPHGYAAGSSPDFVAVGDFNGDGHLDLAVANVVALVGDGNGGNVSILLGNGDGTFHAAPSYPVHIQPWSVTVGDFNGDGIPDLVSANANSVSVLLGNGDGTFRAANTFAAGAGTNCVAVGDFNGDGKDDIVTTSFDGGNPPRNPGTNASQIWIFLGNGDGTFQQPVVYNTELGPISVAVGDFNGDGIPDLAVANSGSFAMPGSTVSILLGKGDGTFQAAQGYTIGNFPRSVVVGDLNGDGRLDVVVANNRSNSVSVLLGNGDGTFQATHNYAAGAAPNSVAVGDFNGDGVPDLAVANDSSSPGSNTVSILLGRGDGTFQAALRYPVGIAPLFVAVSDFNRDGFLDLAVTNLDRTVSVLLGNGDGTFQAARSYGAGTWPMAVAVGDFNSDGFPDLAVSNYFGTVSILLNAADWPR